MKVEIQGLDKFLAGLKKYPQYSIDEMGKAVARSVGLLQSQTIKEAPVNKVANGGNLRQSVRSSMKNKLSGEVRVDANYGIFVHEGTSPHEIRATNAKVLANRRTGQFFGKVVRHPGTRANPFLQRAINLVNPRMNELFKEAIDKVLKKVAGVV